MKSVESHDSILRPGRLVYDYFDLRSYYILMPINLVPNFTHRGRLVIRGRCCSFDQPSVPPGIYVNSNKGALMVVGPDYTHMDATYWANFESKTWP